MKKEKQILTKKNLLFYLFVTVILGTVAYYLGSSITKYILDQQHNKNDSMQLQDLIEPDSLENLKFTAFLNQFNDLLKKVNLTDYQIHKEDLDTYKITIHDIKFSFIISDGNINIAAISYTDENDTIKQLITALIRANNRNIDEESTILLFNKTKETLNEKTNISEYFQYKGVETSLKKINNVYQFRVGRITNS